MDNIVLNEGLHSDDFLSFSLATLFNFCKIQSSCQMIRSPGVPPREDLIFCVHLGQFSVCVMELSSGDGKTDLFIAILEFWVSGRTSQNI